MDMSELQKAFDILANVNKDKLDPKQVEKIKRLLESDENAVSLYEYSDSYDPDFITLIDELGNGGGYDWATLKVYRNNLNGLIGWGYASGCSCSSWTDTYREFKDLQILTDWNQFVREIFDCREGDATEKVELIAKVAKVWNESRSTT